MSASSLATLGLRSGTRRMADDSANTRSRWLAPEVILMAIGILISSVLAFAAWQVRQSGDEQTMANMKVTYDQQIGDLKQTIVDMKSQLIPKRMQTVEDSLQAMQQSYSAQFTAMQNNIQSVQNAMSQANQINQATLHDIATQLNSQGTIIATMGVQMGYLLSAPPDGKTRK